MAVPGRNRQAGITLRTASGIGAQPCAASHHRGALPDSPPEPGASSGNPTTSVPEYLASPAVLEGARLGPAMAIWEQQVLERGIERGIARGLAPARHMLALLYEARFGPVPAAIRAGIEAAADPDTLTRWSDLVARGSREEVDRALGAAQRAKGAARPRSRRA